MYCMWHYILTCVEIMSIFKYIAGVGLKLTILKSFLLASLSSSLVFSFSPSSFLFFCSLVSHPFTHLALILTLCCLCPSILLKWRLTPVVSPFQSLCSVFNGPCLAPVWHLTTGPVEQTEAGFDFVAASSLQALMVVRKCCEFFGLACAMLNYSLVCSHRYPCQFSVCWICVF